MKSRIVRVLLTLGVVVSLSSAVCGQAAPAQMFKVNVPFTFVAGGMNLPAGEYTLSHMMNSNWVLISSSDGKTIATTQVLESAVSQGQAGTKLVFNKYGEKYFLSQVWTANDHQVHECMKSSVERELANSGRQSSQVAVVEYRK